MTTNNSTIVSISSEDFKKVMNLLERATIALEATAGVDPEDHDDQDDFAQQCEKDHQQFVDYCETSHKNFMRGLDPESDFAKYCEKTHKDFVDYCKKSHEDFMKGLEDDDLL